MVKAQKSVTPTRALTGKVRRAAYSAAGLGIVSGLVAVLGAPVKWR